eukprot:scaffold847_cov172-Ochromonas_danica.AAC.10
MNALSFNEEQKFENFTDNDLALFLHKRFTQKVFFTYIGKEILVAVNPSDSAVTSKENIKIMKDYLDHIYTFISNATPSSQSKPADSTSGRQHAIIISGKRGSGKSKCYDLMLASILGDYSKKNEESILLNQKSDSARRVFDAFGCAMLKHSFCSTHFVKVTQVGFNSSHQVQDCRWRCLLFESSRLVQPPAEERNFNIFYQMTAAATYRKGETLNDFPFLKSKRWNLLEAEEYQYLNQTSCCFPEGKLHDATNFKELVKALLHLGVAQDSIKAIFDLLAGILALGQVKFSALEGTTANQVNSSSSSDPIESGMSLAASLLQVDAHQLSDMVASKSIKISNKEVIKCRVNKEQAKVNCDTVVKAVYKGCFDWILVALNGGSSDESVLLSPSLFGSRERKVGEQFVSSIILIDMFGTGSTSYNSVDQLCMNYAAEAVQQYFIQFLYQEEMDIYKAEGVSFQKLICPDYQSGLNFIDDGVFKILDECCEERIQANMIADSNNFFSEIMAQYPDDHPYFSSSALQFAKNSFMIKHYVSGPVEYDSEGFMKRNIDSLPSNIAEVFSSSSNPLLVGLMAGTPVSTVANGRRRASAAFNRMSSVYTPSLVKQFRINLDGFLRDLQDCRPHLVKCIKGFSAEDEAVLMNVSFRFSSSELFQASFVLNELKCSGIMDVLSMARSGFWARLFIMDFYVRYRVLFQLSDEGKGLDVNSVFSRVSTQDVAKRCDELLDHLKQKLDSDHPGFGNGLHRGKTIVFIRKDVLQIIEVLRNVKHTPYICKIQTIWRGFVVRRDVAKRKRLVVLVQRNYRRHKLFRSIRALQCCWRRYASRQLAKWLRERKKRLDVLVKSLVQAKQMRKQRRSRSNHLAKDDGWFVAIPSPLARLRKQQQADNELYSEIVAMLMSNAAMKEEAYFKTLTIKLTNGARGLASSSYKQSIADYIVKAKPADSLVLSPRRSPKPAKKNPLNRIVRFCSGWLASADELSPISPVQDIIDHTRTLINRTGEEIERSSSNPSKAVAKVDKLKYIERLLSLILDYYTTFVDNYVSKASRVEADNAAKDLEAEAKNKTQDGVLYLNETKLRLDWSKNSFIIRSPHRVYKGYGDDILARVDAVLAERDERFLKESLRFQHFGSIAYQHMPTRPGLAFAVNTFYQFVYRRMSMDPKRIVRLKSGKQNRIVYFQATSLSATPSSFMDILYDAVSLEKIDIKSYTAAVITCLVLGITNVQPQHILLCEDSENACLKIREFNPDDMLQVLLLDPNQESEENQKKEKGINMLYCLPFVEEKLDNEICAWLCSPTFRVDDFIVSWVYDVYVQNERYKDLARRHVLNATDMDALKLPIQLPPESLRAINRRFQRLITTLRSADNLSHLCHEDLLEAVESKEWRNFYEQPRRYSDLETGLPNPQGLSCFAYIYHQTLHQPVPEVVEGFVAERLDKSPDEEKNEESVLDSIPVDGIVDDDSSSSKSLEPSTAAIKADTVVVKEKQMRVAYSSISMVGENKTPIAFSLFSKSIEDEALTYMMQIDFRYLAEIQPLEQAMKACEVIGENLSFLPAMHLNFANEWQLSSIFSYWLKQRPRASSFNMKRSNSSRQETNTVLKLCTSVVTLLYDDEDRMHAIKDSTLFSQLRRDLKLTVRFAIVKMPVAPRPLRGSFSCVVQKLRPDQMQSFSFNALNGAANDGSSVPSGGVQKLRLNEMKSLSVEDLNAGSNGNFTDESGMSFALHAFGPLDKDDRDHVSMDIYGNQDSVFSMQSSMEKARF